MTPKSAILLPPKHLSSCIAAAIVRDTRGSALPDIDRFNYFPATPLVTVTYILQGELRLVDIGASVEVAQDACAMAPISVIPPQNNPTASWSPSDVFVLTVGFYPDALVKLGADTGFHAVPDEVASVVMELNTDGNVDEMWDRYCASLAPVWDAGRDAGGLPDWPGSDLVADWSRYVISRMAMSLAGRSARTWERRLRQWTGKTRQQLELFSAVEDLYRRSVQNPDEPLAQLAVITGFADQSHMGRAVRRTTGFSPARLNKLIETAEPFWCYRLLGARF